MKKTIILAALLLTACAPGLMKDLDNQLQKVELTPKAGESHQVDVDADMQLKPDELRGFQIPDGWLEDENRKPLGGPGFSKQLQIAIEQ